MSWGGRKVPRLRQQVVETYGRTCHLCGMYIHGTVSVDHLIPRSKGGTDDIRNLRPAHLKCNSRRGNKSVPSALVTTIEW
ncbi:MAG: HNH endonuclease [Gammaproteobacteria bacterium]|nr:HNH endonuclease [Gammaproteobacteria bacterium]